MRRFTTEEFVALARLPRFRWARPAAVAGCVLTAAACSNAIAMAGDGGSVPLDAPRAAALARRRVCGAPGTPTDSACVVRRVERVGGDYLVVLDRQPPASGGDRVAVRLRDDGMRVEVSEVRADSTLGR